MAYFIPKHQRRTTRNNSSFRRNGGEHTIASLFSLIETRLLVVVPQRQMEYSVSAGETGIQRVFGPSGIRDPSGNTGGKGGLSYSLVNAFDPPFYNNGDVLAIEGQPSQFVGFNSASLSAV